MREKAILCAAAFLAIFLISAGLPAIAAQPASEYTVKVNRVAQIGTWGLVIVNDTLTVQNESEALLDEVPIGLPREYKTALRYLGARDDHTNVLMIDRDVDPSSETYWFKVHFARGLQRNEIYSFTVTSVFTGLLLPKEGGFQYRFVLTPVLQVRTTSANMTVMAGPRSRFSIPQGFNVTQAGEEGPVSLTGSFASVEPYTAKPFVLNMTSPGQFIVHVPQVTREIWFEADGRIRVSDTYQLENLAGPLTTIEITLPKNSSDVMAYDLIGALWDNPVPGDRVTVSPRYSGGVAQNKTFTFTLRYQVDPRTYLTRSQWWGANEYKSALLSNVKDMAIDKLETNVILPAGFNVKNVSPSPSSTSGSLFNRDLRFVVTDVTPYKDLQFSLDYTYVPFWSGSLLTGWVALIELVAVAAILVTRTRKPPELKIPVPSEKLRQFVELYDGRTALRLELDRMAEDLARGALNKHEYRRRRKAIETRKGELDRALQPLKQDLKTFHPRYSEMILRMEKAEAEIDANRLGEEHFRAQYRSGKMSKEAYDRAVEDLRRRVDKARELIETSLVTIREEAR